MDSIVTLLSPKNVLVIIIGYAIAVFAARFIIDPIATKLWKKHVKDENNEPIDDEINELKISIGYLDRFIFTTSFLAGYVEFIPIWLIARAAGDWPRGEKIDIPAIRYISFIGNGLSMVISVGIAWVIRTAIGLA